MILDAWELQPAEQAVLLGLHCDLVTRLPAYRTGEKSLPDLADVLERAGTLVEIHHMLGLVFPWNSDERYKWVRQSNARFCEGRKPLDLMLDYGLRGIRRVEWAVESLLG